MGTRMTSSRAYLALMKETAESEKMRARIAEPEAQAKTVEAGYVAARQEIASLRAQPYDQQAMGLCHVCGWKGVIDYPDGPVCVACEHDKTLSPQPTAQAQAQAMPAPGVEAVSEREFKQFLSDVLTAAGLVTHGKKCKDLGRRLGEMSMRLRTAPKTAAAPVQAHDALKEIGAIAVSALETNSRYIADWREDIDRIAAIAAQKGNHD